MEFKLKNIASKNYEFRIVGPIELTENEKNAESVNKIPAQITAEDDESYAKSSTGITKCTTHDDRIVKILGIKWNTLSRVPYTFCMKRDWAIFFLLKCYLSFY